MVMPADSSQDQGEPFALQLLRAGFSVIPLDPNSKQPSERWLVKRSWRPYQSVRASEQIVQQWLSDDALNWGVVCGQISHGLYCGDIDSPEFSKWVLDDPNRAVFRGAAIVRSGSGKAHVWFVSPNQIISTKWKLGDGNVGDIRGDGRPGTGGSYMVVPPSIHPETGKRYEMVAGSLLHLPVISDGKAFLTEILRAYRGDPTIQFVEADAHHTSKDILTLSDADIARVTSRVRQLKLPRKIADTLLTAGCQDPMSDTWARGLTDLQFSHSEIDFAVCCRLIEKNQSFEEIEEIFAATLVGAACYADPERPNHGRSYLWATYQKARESVERSKQMARVAAGDNFRMQNVVRIRYGKNTSAYRCDLIHVDDLDRHETLYSGIMLSDNDLTNERLARQSVFRQTEPRRIMLRWNAAHKGNEFYRFVEALEGMVLETEDAPTGFTSAGLVASRMRPELYRMVQSRIPLHRKELRGMGWDNGDGSFSLIVSELAIRVQSMERRFEPEGLRAVLDELGEWRPTIHNWPDGRREEVINLTLRL